MDKSSICILLDEITPGPYFVIMRGVDEFGYDVEPFPSGMRGQFEHQTDAQFLASAPSIIADLLVEIEMMRRQLEIIAQESEGDIKGLALAALSQ